MGIDVATAGTGETQTDGPPAWPGGCLDGDAAARGALALRVTEDRILIRADEEAHAPRALPSGILRADSLQAAVTGSDPAPSWFTGTVVQVGPQVNKRDVRKQLAGWLLELESEGHDIAVRELAALRFRVEALRADVVDPVQVGQRVVFSWASGQQVRVDGTAYVILRAADVLAVMEDDDGH